MFFEKNWTETKNFLQKITNSDTITIKKILDETEKIFSTLSFSEPRADFNLHSPLIVNRLNEPLRQFFSKYIEFYKIYQAMFMLATTNLSIKEIASSLGFCSSSRFMEKFTAKFDLTPLEFRSRFKTKDTLREENRFLY